MEFYCYSPSETFVVLTADQFVGRDDGLLQQRRQDSHVCRKTRDFNFLGEDKLIFTMDITSLYTIIPNCEGRLALKHFFDLRNVKEPNSETLLRLAELVLTLNCFSFAGSYYKQINGVAMGTKMGPSYANLFVGYIEHQFFNQYNGPKPYGAFFLSKFNLIVVFVYHLRFSNSTFLSFNHDNRFSTSTFVLFNFDTRFLNSTFVLFKRDIGHSFTFFPTSTFVLFNFDTRFLSSTFVFFLRDICHSFSLFSTLTFILFNLDSRFPSSKFVSFKREVRILT